MVRSRKNPQYLIHIMDPSCVPEVSRTLFNRTLKYWKLSRYGWLPVGHFILHTGWEFELLGYNGTLNYPVRIPEEIIIKLL